MNILDMKHIKKSFDGKIVLQDIDLQISPGEVVSILGPSGSGNPHCFAVRHFWKRLTAARSHTTGKVW